MNERRRAEIVQALADIQAVADTGSFKAVIAELNSLPYAERHQFVEQVLVDRAKLRAKGIALPPDIVLQRSYFRDGRPTLFCLSKRLPAGHPWDKVTLTWDNPHVAESR